MSESIADADLSIICSSCGASWSPADSLRERMFRELSGWDRRADSPLTVLEGLFHLLRKSGEAPLQEPSGGRAAHG